MLELIIIGFVFWMGYQIGISVISYRLRHLIFKEAKRLGLDKDIQTELPTVEQLVIESANGVLYLYDRNNSFICQGKTLDELATLAKQYKNIKYAAVLHDNDTYGFVDGVVKTYTEIVK